MTELSAVADNPAPIAVGDPINARILAVSEDRLQGFLRKPFEEIARLSGIELPVVLERIREMLRGGTIRRVRQTLVSTNLAPGALVAWRVPADRLDAAFEWMFRNDPFSGHVVIRSTDQECAGSGYRLWTTLKVPDGFSMEKHARYLQERVGAEHFRLMPAKAIFTLGVGHVRRKDLEFGSRAEVLAEPQKVEFTRLTSEEWRVLIPLKREFRVD
ncbi:MAG: Lrp/AsnC family transcriptional regulator, partial [Verrucomicrobiae bacterium]|nr:Lrp/AsnC family transcriptional regulator [Verrucomicrobiae bacterium]